MIQTKVEGLIQNISEVLPEDVSNIAWVCIGTDRSTGDCFGPMVGTYLKYRSIENVYGTVTEPVHAVNLAETLEEVSSKGYSFVVGIDACLGQSSRVGTITAKTGPVKPGAGVYKDLPPVGDANIYAVVNVGGFMEYFVLQNTRLGLVMTAAEMTASAIEQVINSRKGVMAV